MGNALSPLNALVQNPSPLQAGSIVYAGFQLGVFADSILLPAYMFWIASMLMTYLLGTFTYTLVELQVYLFLITGTFSIANGWFLKWANYAPSWLGWSIINKRNTIPGFRKEGEPSIVMALQLAGMAGGHVAAIVVYEVIPDKIWASVAFLAAAIVFNCLDILNIRNSDVSRDPNSKVRGEDIGCRQLYAYKVWYACVIVIAMGLYRCIPNNGKFSWFFVAMIVNWVELIISFIIRGVNNKRYVYDYTRVTDK